MSPSISNFFPVIGFFQSSHPSYQFWTLRGFRPILLYSCLGLRIFFRLRLRITNRVIGFSIVAVPGLVTSIDSWGWAPRTSQQGDQGKKLWLADLLPQDFPSARVMAFGYDGLPIAEDLASKTKSLISIAKSLLNHLKHCRLQQAVGKSPSL